jgi:glutathione S-transferase
MSDTAPARILYDLAGADDAQRFSPYCFRVKIALKRKNLPYATEIVRLTEKDKLAFSGQPLLPVLRDGAQVLPDSWKILQYLDAQYPQAPLFDANKLALHNALRHWCEKTLHVGFFRVAAPFIFAALGPKDQGYFRETREKRLGQTLESLSAERDKHLATLHFLLEPLRGLLAEQDFLDGSAAGLADVMVFSAFLWVQAVVPFAMVAAEDPIAAWLVRTDLALPR